MWRTLLLSAWLPAGMVVLALLRLVLDPGFAAGPAAIMALPAMVMGLALTWPAGIPLTLALERLYPRSRPLAFACAAVLCPLSVAAVTIGGLFGPIGIWGVRRHRLAPGLARARAARRCRASARKAAGIMNGGGKALRRFPRSTMTWRTTGGAALVVTALAAGGVQSQAAGGGTSGSGSGAAATTAQGRQAPFDAQQRRPGDPQLVARGQALYGIHCRGCHGIDLRGGDLGGPNLLRSQLLLRDREGERIWPVLRDGQSTPGGSSMPPQSLSEADARAVAEYMHSVLGRATPQGGLPRDRSWS